MTSPVKLPPLPCEVGLVRALFRGQPDYFEAQDSYYTQDQMRAYAEQAVREALAGQEPVAWMMTKRRFHSEPGFTKIDPSRVFESEYVRLAIITEKDHGEPS